MSEIDNYVVSYTVPRTKEAMDTWLPGVMDYDKYDYYEVKEELNNTLWKLYDVFNKRFGIIIDNCEDEVLLQKNLAEALALVEEFSSGDLNDDQKEVLGKLHSAIVLAMKYGTCLFFDF